MHIEQIREPEMETEAQPRWWHTPFRMFQTNLREVDAGLDVEHVLDFIQAHGANTWLVNAGGILSFYPTDLPFQTRNPYLSLRPSGDLLGDAVVATHARGMRQMARLDFSKISARIAAEHPEWCYVSPVGQRQEVHGLVSVCPSGGYYQERTFDILDEVLDRYPVDGFFFNWFGYNEVDYSKVYHGVCHCLNCQRAFHRYSGGRELPTGPTSSTYGEWLRFTSDTIRDLTERLRAHIAARRPTACLLGRTGDIIFHEANNALGRPLWPHATGEAVSVARSYRPDMPVLVNAVTFMDMPYRMAGEQPEHFAQYFVQTISRGGNPSTYIMGTPGQIPYPCLPVAGEITRFHARWQRVYDGMQPVAKTALVRPDRLSQAAAAHQHATVEYRGIYQALQERHIPFDIIAQEQIGAMRDNGSLARYALVILPDLGALGAETAATLDAFVETGGRVLTTGSSGLGAEAGADLTCLGAARQLAVTDQAQALWSTYVVPEQDVPNDANSAVGPVAPVYGAYHFCAWKPDAQPRWVLLAHAPYGPPEKAYGNVPVKHPGYVLRAHGSGHAATIPWTVGRAYHDLGLAVLKELLCSVVEELLAGAETISADLPEQVEMTVHRTGDATVLHCINFSGARRTNFGPPLPVREARVRVTGVPATATAHALVSDTACTVTPDGDGVTVTLPEFGLFAVIVIGEPAVVAGLRRRATDA